MDHSDVSFGLSSETSTAVGKLIVRMHSEGLFTSDDVQRTLRAALAPAAAALQASLLEAQVFMQGMREGYLAAE